MSGLDPKSETMGNKVDLRVIGNRETLNIAVTGATGFIGSHLTKSLLKNGHKLTLIARGQTKKYADLLEHPNSRFFALDIGETSLVEAFQGCDAVFHCAGINRESGTQSYQRVHLDGTQNVVNAAIQNGVKHIVLLSYLRVQPGSCIAYHQSKWEAEEIVRTSGLSHTILRSTMNYGQGDHFLNHLSRAMATFPIIPLVGQGDTLVRPVAIEDTVKVMTASLAGLGLQGTYALVGPDEIPLRDMIFQVGEVVGRKPKYIKLPTFLYRFLAWLFERIMKIPIVSRAQVEILAEDLSRPASDCSELPAELQPSKPFTPEQIGGGLSKRQPLGLSYCLMCIAKGGSKRTGRCPVKDAKGETAFEAALEKHDETTK